MALLIRIEEARAALGARVARGAVQSRDVLVDRTGRATWPVLHALGAHRWQEGYETDLERGWRRYRGSRCTICDTPWEGW
jgi:hypothetical protein